MNKVCRKPASEISKYKVFPLKELLKQLEGGRQNSELLKEAAKLGEIAI